jgi:hypothetical protein
MNALLLVPLLLFSGMVMGESRVPIGEFSSDRMQAWQERSFVGHTQYQLADKDGQRVLHAHSQASASGLYREIELDLKQTPYLHWSWRTDRLFEDNDETRRAGDDYPVRVYVVFSGGVRFWRTRAINYVWSSQQPLGSEWPNAFTSNARMIAVDAGHDKLGQWQSHRRNVLEDYRRLFGQEPSSVNAVAIMTDSDNTGQSAEAWYGDIWFSGQ